MKNQGPRVFNILAFIFAGRRQAFAIHDDLKAGKKYAARGVIASTVVEVDEQGKPYFHPAGRSTEGAAIGLLTGGIVGLLGGPEGLLVWAVLGAIIGRQVGKRLDGPIPQQDLRRLADQMQPDTSALLALLEREQSPALIDEVAAYQAEVVQLPVNDVECGQAGSTDASSSDEERTL